MKLKKLQNYLIAVDLDGTLVDSHGRNDKKSFRLLKKLSKNNYVVIATGRPWRISESFYQLLKLETPIINYNGSLVHNPSNPLFTEYHEVIPKEDMIKLTEAFNDSMTIFCEIRDDIYLNKEDQTINKYLYAMPNTKVTVGKFKDTLTCNPHGAIILLKSGFENKLKDYINKTFPNTYAIRFWCSDGEHVVCEFHKKCASKLNALLYISKYYNIPFDKTIAIGDAENDLKMIEGVKYGALMGNSHPSLTTNVKKILPIEKHGVYYFLKSLNKKLI